MIQRRPAVYRGIVSLRSISFIGYGFTDNSDFLIARDRERVVQAFFDFMFENKALWDEILITQIADTSPNLELVDREGRERGCRVVKKIVIDCPYVETLGDAKEYNKSLTKKLRKDVARNIRRIEEQGIELKFEVLTTLEEDTLDKLRQLSRKRFEATGHRSLLLREDRYEFIRELAPVFNERGWWHLFLFTVKENIAAYMLCFSYHNVIYAWNTSYDIEYNPYSLGKLIIHRMISYCFENGYRALDFMAGGEQFKQWWTEKRRTNYSIAIQKRNLSTWLAEMYSSLKRRIGKSGS